MIDIQPFSGMAHVKNNIGGIHPVQGICHGRGRYPEGFQDKRHQRHRTLEKTQMFIGRLDFFKPVYREIPELRQQVSHNQSGDDFAFIPTGFEFTIQNIFRCVFLLKRFLSFQSNSTWRSLRSFQLIITD
jgi:hypothetical protein